MVTIKPAKLNRTSQREGLSLVELLMAMTLDNHHPYTGPQIGSICGHYVKWGGQSSDPTVTLAHGS